MKTWLAVLATVFVVQTANAAWPWVAKPETSSPVDSSAPLILGAPPRLVSEDVEIFGSMAKYLSTVIQRQIVFEPASAFSIYQTNIQAGKYDLVVDGAHLTGWRIKNRGYDALVKVSGAMHFVVIVPVDSRIKTLANLRGRMICTMNPPHLGFLVVQSLFGPVKQPGIKPFKTLADVYNGVRDKKCDAGIVRDVMVKKFDPEGKTMRTIHQHDPIPNETLSAGQRVTAAEKTKIIDALLAINLDNALVPYQKTYMLGGRFERATNADYLRFVKLLDGQIGF